MYDTNLGLLDLSDSEAQAIVGGPTAVEYAVMLALIIVVCLPKAPLGTLSGSFSNQLQ